MSEKIEPGNDPWLTHKCVDLAVELDVNLDKFDWESSDEDETLEFQRALKSYLNFLKSVGAI